MERTLITEDVKKVLVDTFKTLRDDVVIEVYTLKGMNDAYNEAVIDLIKTLAEITPKVKASFHGVGDEQARKRDVQRSPTILIDPDKYRIRFTGSPLGEEGRSLILALVMASTRSITLTEESLKRLMDLNEKREIQVFVSPT